MLQWNSRSKEPPAVLETVRSAWRQASIVAVALPSGTSPPQMVAVLGNSWHVPAFSTVHVTS